VDWLTHSLYDLLSVMVLTSTDVQHFHHNIKQRSHCFLSGPGRPHMAEERVKAGSRGCFLPNVPECVADVRTTRWPRRAPRYPEERFKVYCLDDVPRTCFEAVNVAIIGQGIRDYQQGNSRHTHLQDIIVGSYRTGLLVSCLFAVWHDNAIQGLRGSYVASMCSVLEGTTTLKPTI